jgi:hypothetical protein
MTSNQTAGQSSRRRAAGAAVERKMCERYGLEPDHSGRADAAYPTTGTPVEIKGAQRLKSDGRGGTKPGEFFIYKARHRWVRRRDGYYVFVVYRFRGKGVQILDAKRVHSSNIPRGNGWIESGHPGRGHDKERRIKVSGVFG